MKRNLTGMLALLLVFVAGLVQAAFADENVHIREAAYSESRGLGWP